MNIAMLLTASRVVVAPLFAWLFISGFERQSVVLILAACGAAAFIELSDMFDGMVARARREVTDFGKIFDPVADAVSRQVVFLSFLMTGIIPLWMFCVFLYRDAFVQFLRIVCASTGIVLAARKSGKFKAIVQAIATFAVIIIVLLRFGYPGLLPAEIAGNDPCFWAVAVAAAVTAYSLFDYVIPNWPSISKMLERK